MDNQVSVLKNGIILPVESLEHIEAPFQFVVKDKLLAVEPGDRVCYFQRRRMRIHKGQVTQNFIYKICVGSIKADGTNDRHWFSPTGDYLEPNVEPIKES